MIDQNTADQLACGGLVATESYAVTFLVPPPTKLTRRRIISYLDVRIGGSGIIGGTRLASRLEQSIGGIAIEDLPVRFAAIATEIGTCVYRKPKSEHSGDEARRGSRVTR